MTEFSTKTIEELKSYVYVLIDPRDNKIFYVGKGTCNRVFQHAKDALETYNDNDKLETIRNIISNGKEVKHYIIRHGLEDKEAFIAESILIDFLTFKDFSEVAKITNLVAGHHSFDKGIKTVEELEQIYNCEELEKKDIRHNLLVININKTYNQKKVKEDIYSRSNIYEATRGWWVLDKTRAEKCDYVLSEYRGIVRAIFKPDKWGQNKEMGNKRWGFEGTEVIDKEIKDLYLHKDISKYKLKGSVNPIRYFEKANVQ